MQLYYQPHKNRKKEAAFVQALKDQFQFDNIINKNYPMPDLSGNINISRIQQNLAAQRIIDGKWVLLSKHLESLPDVIKVFLKPSRISCDVVILKDGQPHFIEYHEKQHKTLSVNRPASIYALDGTPITVPRYVQRYLRDQWRLENLRPFTVIWDEYFNEHRLENIKFFSDGMTLYS